MVCVAYVKGAWCLFLPALGFEGSVVRDTELSGLDGKWSTLAVCLGELSARPLPSSRAKPPGSFLGEIKLGIQGLLQSVSNSLFPSNLRHEYFSAYAQRPSYKLGVIGMPSPPAVSPVHSWLLFPLSLLLWPLQPRSSLPSLGTQGS